MRKNWIGLVQAIRVYLDQRIAKTSGIQHESVAEAQTDPVSPEHTVHHNIGKYIRLERTVIQPFGHVSVGVEVDGTSSIADAVPCVHSS